MEYDIEEYGGRTLSGRMCVGVDGWWWIGVT